MCFSASASYTASIVLLLSGIATTRIAKPKQRMFAAIPLLFAAQQFLEGTIWQAIAAGKSATTSTYGFLIFVFLVWPIWTPLSIRIMSKNDKTKRLLLFPITTGILVALLAAWNIASQTPQAALTCNHIHYFSALPAYLWIPGTILYIIATITPFFIVRDRYFWLAGTLAAFAYLISFTFYYETMLSVWCFFAAILSLFIMIIIRKNS